MNREAQVWIKIIMHALFQGLHFTKITRDRVFLAYAFITKAMLNIRAICKSSIRPKVSMGAIRTTTVRAYRDEHIMVRIYGLELLRHQSGGRPSILAEIDEVEVWYLLHNHTTTVLCIGTKFFEPMEDDVP